MSGFKSSKQRKKVMMELNKNNSNTSKFQDRMKEKKEKSQKEVSKSKTYGDATNEELLKEREELVASSIDWHKNDEYDNDKLTEYQEKKRKVLEERKEKERQLNEEKESRLIWYDNSIKEIETDIERKQEDIKFRKAMSESDDYRVQIIDKILKDRKG